MRAAHDALKRTQQQLLHSEKMASLGQLVAGVAHELNNPISFVLGNVHALRKYCDRLQTYMGALHAQAGEAELATLRQQLRIEHLLSDLPSLIEGTLEGAQRTADIVHGLKRFSAMDSGERAFRWTSTGSSSAPSTGCKRGARVAGRALAARCAPAGAGQRRPAAAGAHEPAAERGFVDSIVGGGGLILLPALFATFPGAPIPPRCWAPTRARLSGVQLPPPGNTAAR
jgi:hypothetical protein